VAADAAVAAPDDHRAKMINGASRSSARRAFAIYRMHVSNSWRCKNGGSQAGVCQVGRLWGGWRECRSHLDADVVNAAIWVLAQEA